MNIRFLNFFAFLFIFPMLFSQSQTISLSGFVVDAVTHQPVSQAIVVMLETGNQKTTDDKGEFLFEQLTRGWYTFSVRHIAFADIERRIFEKEVLRCEEIAKIALNNSEALTLIYNIKNRLKGE